MLAQILKTAATCNSGTVERFGIWAIMAVGLGLTKANGCRPKAN